MKGGYLILMPVRLQVLVIRLLWYPVTPSISKGWIVAHRTVLVLEAEVRVDRENEGVEPPV
jgi:hypothetical protein